MNSTLKPRWSVAVPRQFETVSREMDQVFDHFFGSGREGVSWRAPADLWEEDGRWCVEVDLPGVKQEDIDITLEKNALKLAVERHPSDQERKFHHQERAYGRIERVIALPETVDPDTIEAELNSGVLRLSLAKRPELQPKKIQIKAN